MTDDGLLATYLNDHLTGATGGGELFKRVAKNHAGTDRGSELARLADEIAEDRGRLRRLMSSLGIRENRPMHAMGWLAEKAGRLKPNGYIVRRSPLSEVVELEGLRVAVAAKSAGWQVLRVAAEHDPRIPTELVDTLIERAEDQSSRLHRLHLSVAEENLARPQH